VQMPRVLYEVVEVDVVMNQYQGATGPQRFRHVRRGTIHLPRRKIVDEFRDDDDVIARTREVRRHREAYRSRSRRMTGNRISNKAGSSGSRLGCVQSKGARRDCRAVGAVARGKLEYATPRAGPHCVEDRRALQRLVAVLERPPGVRIAGEGPLEARERDRLHERAAANSSLGRLNAATWWRDNANPCGSSVIRPVWVR